MHLTHSSQDKNLAIYRQHFRIDLLCKKCRILIQMAMECDLSRSINSKQTIVYITA